MPALKKWRREYFVNVEPWTPYKKWIGFLHVTPGDHENFLQQLLVPIERIAAIVEDPPAVGKPIELKVRKDYRGEDEPYLVPADEAQAFLWDMREVLMLAKQHPLEGFGYMYLKRPEPGDPLAYAFSNSIPVP